MVDKEKTVCCKPILRFGAALFMIIFVVLSSLAALISLFSA